MSLCHPVLAYLCSASAQADRERHTQIHKERDTFNLHSDNEDEGGECSRQVSENEYKRGSGRERK